MADMFGDFEDEELESKRARVEPEAAEVRGQGRDDEDDEQDAKRQRTGSLGAVHGKKVSWADLGDEEDEARRAMVDTTLCDHCNRKF